MGVAGGLRCPWGEDGWWHDSREAAANRPRSTSPRCGPVVGQKEFAMLWMLPRRRAPSLLMVVLLAAAVPVSAARVAPRAYAVVDLGVPAGAEHVEARDINAAGAVVGSLIDDRLARQAFYWEGGRFRSLTIDGGEGVAWDINDFGEAVGVAYHPSPGVTRAVRWTNPAATGRGKFLGGDYSAALGIDDAGRVVGAAGRGNAQRATLWQDGRATDLGTLGGPSQAVAINARGQIAGSASLGPLDVGPNHAVLWDGSRPTDLGTLGGDESLAWQINDTGVVVGESETVSGEHQARRAFRWQGGTMEDLGTLPGFAESGARGINNAGQIVGFAANPNTPDSVAVLWDGGRIVDLNTLLPPDSGVALRAAVAINDTGQILGQGWAGADRRTRSFVLTPATSQATPSSSPEPPSSQMRGDDVDRPDSSAAQRSRREGRPARPRRRASRSTVSSLIPRVTVRWGCTAPVETVTLLEESSGSPTNSLPR